MHNVQNFIQDYLLQLNESFNQMSKEGISNIIRILLDGYKRDKRIFIFGNGGSASTSSHFANDLNKLCSIEGKKRFKAIALTDNIPLMTAWANDSHYNLIFVEQLKNLMEEGDIIIAISGSGNSENVCKAVEYSKQMKGITIGMLGFDGGKLKNLVDNNIMIKSNVYGVIEDAHLCVCHIITNYIRDSMKSETF